MDESSLLLRQIPHSVEAEQSVLGAMLIDPRCIPNVVEQLTGEDFYLKPNRDIYETIYTMFSFSATIDPVTVLDQMKLRGVYDENTTSNYLLQLMEITPTAANVSEYIRIVKDKALLRRISETAGELTTLVQEGGETAQAVLDLAEQRIYAIRQGKSSQGLEPLSKILVDVFDRLQELSMSGSDVPGMATGFADLDRTLTGFHGSELILLAARPGMGKTSFALNEVLRQERGFLLPGNEPGAAGHPSHLQRGLSGQQKADDRQALPRRLGQRDRGLHGPGPHENFH